MAQFYLGYGHASIADCGFITLYFEGISMIAAKAIEDNPLFNGQECSSRYIDFSNQPFINPFVAAHDAAEAQTVLDACRQFYVENLDPVLDHLEKQYPRDPAVTEITYYKTLKAKAFDILRGFLPGGATTNVAWTTSLRKASENLITLMHHPLQEIQTMAAQAYAQLYETYPSSFKKEYAEIADAEVTPLALVSIEGIDLFRYRSRIDHFYAADPREIYNFGLRPVTPTPLYIEGDINDKTLGSIPRTSKDPLPRHCGLSTVALDMSVELDYGSFRDIQRHRGGYCSMPMLTIKRGFHRWYYDNLPEQSQLKADELFKQIDELNRTRSQVRQLYLQYATPMGCIVPVTLKYNVAQAVYVSELRSSKTVHPTLRPVAQKMASFLKDAGIDVNADMDESDWTTRRGTQDIISK
jgi:thymidylate synthase ThyX